MHLETAAFQYGIHYITHYNYLVLSNFFFPLSWWSLGGGGGGLCIWDEGIKFNIPCWKLYSYQT